MLRRAGEPCKEMSKNKRLKDFEKVIRECVKCGVCQAHCPTYQVGKREGDVARGKVALAAALLEGDTTLEERLRQDMSMCLMCGSCMNKCPNKVPTHEIVGAVRREITDNRGLSPVGKGISTLLGSKFLLKSLVKGGALVSPLVMKKIPDSSGLRLRFRVPKMEHRTLPKLPIKNLFDMVPEYTEGRPGKPVIGFFAGCSISYVYPETGKQMVDILKLMGCSIYLPRQQKCCGIPALSSGNGQLVEELAENNIQSFTQLGVDQIITACASCNGGISEYYGTMNANYSDFTSKVIDFSVFLQKQGLFEKLERIEKWSDPVRVAYHDPCHLKTQGITKEPRAMLKSLPNVEFVEMAGADTCCGLGGTFSVYHYDASKAIGAKKMVGLRESGAELLATACPGCIMQLQDSINHDGLKVRAVHLLELLSKALQ